MASRTIPLTEDLGDYLRHVAVRESDILERLRAETEGVRGSQMQITSEQGALMALLVQLIGARRTLEVGVYTGYSSLAVALALPDDGRITACDVSEEWTSIGRRYWDEAGVAHKIDLHLAPAVETLERLVAEGQQGAYDFAFIDADKENYDTYYERALELVRPGGLIAIDNVLWDGNVIDESKTDEMTEAIRAINEKVRTDERVSICMVPIGDGLTLAVKRP